MKLTKFEHACLVVSKNGQRIIIDPGSQSYLPKTQLQNVCGVVLTHQHEDHFGAENVQKIVEANPGVTIYAPPDVAVKHHIVQQVTDTFETQCGDFKLRFYGDEHKPIYGMVPCKNTGVMIDELVYYGGDSFTLPDKKVEVLAVPASAPWMKVSEAMDYIKQIKPKIVFPTHNALLSEFGEHITYYWLQTATENAKGKWLKLQSGDDMDVA